MSFDLSFTGPYAGKLNEGLGCGQKWIRDTVYDYTKISMNRKDGYITPEFLKKIAGKLAEVEKWDENSYFVEVRKLLTRAARMNLGAQVY